MCEETSWESPWTAYPAAAVCQNECSLCLQARSLLTAHEDFTTLQFHAGVEIQRPGFVFSALKQRLP